MGGDENIERLGEREAYPGGLLGPLHPTQEPLYRLELLGIASSGGWMGEQVPDGHRSCLRGELLIKEYSRKMGQSGLAVDVSLLLFIFYFYLVGGG